LPLPSKAYFPRLRRAFLPLLSKCLCICLRCAFHFVIQGAFAIEGPLASKRLSLCLRRTFSFKPTLHI
jgi:hypothetical protein